MAASYWLGDLRLCGLTINEGKFKREDMKDFAYINTKRKSKFSQYFVNLHSSIPFILKGLLNF